MLFVEGKKTIGESLIVFFKSQRVGRKLSLSFSSR